MGGCVSRRPPSPSSLNNVRVVHLNGTVEVFQHPVTVIQVTGKAGKHVLCTPAQLLSVGVKPLQGSALLEGGRIYLMLPQSSFLSHDVSPLDLASMVKKLTAAAAKTSGNAVAHQLATVGDAAAKRPWKPVLDPIREQCFNRMSDSDPREC